MDELKILLNALELSPDNNILRSHIAKLQFDSELYEDAVENYKILYNSDKNNLQFLEYLLKCLVKLEDFSEARKILECENVSLENWPYGLLILSKCLYSSKEYDSAMRNYEKAIGMAPELEDVEFYQNLLQYTSSQKVRLKVVDFPNREDYNSDYVKPQITFKDVAGMESVKESIRTNIIYPFTNPEIYRAYGNSAGGGILLFGPPGCGKTFISMATAGECNANFISISITDILDMYIGESEKNLHAIFETARLKAPSIIFIDEIDAIGGSRQNMMSGATRTLTNQLLMELDSSHNNNNNLLVIGATNAPWYIDPALRRSGRFDRVLFIPPPDLNARIDIFKLCMKDKPQENIDYLLIAKNTDKYSGADIKGICDTASKTAIKMAIQSGKIVPITTEHLLDAIKVVKPSTYEWLRMAKNYATYSNQSGIYDEVLNYFNSIGF